MSQGKRVHARWLGAIGLVAVVGALGAAGCGGDDDEQGTTAAGTTTTEQSAVAGKYAAALAGGFTSQFDVAEDAARCFGDRAVAVIGVDRLQEADVTPHDLGPEGKAADLSTLGVDVGEDDVDGVTAALTDCGIDFGALLAQAVATSDQADCVRDNVDLDAVPAAFSRGIVLGDASDLQEITQEIADACS